MRPIDADKLIKRWSDEPAGAYFFPSEILRSIEEQPTENAQLEPLTDAEQRIFLAAMRREEKFCRQVSDEWLSLGSFDMSVDLLKICSEIERKVKQYLWID